MYCIVLYCVELSYIVFCCTVVLCIIYVYNRTASCSNNKIDYNEKNVWHNYWYIHFSESYNMLLFRLFNAQCKYHSIPFSR